MENEENKPTEEVNDKKERKQRELYDKLSEILDEYKKERSEIFESSKEKDEDGEEHVKTFSKNKVNDRTLNTVREGATIRIYDRFRAIGEGKITSIDEYGALHGTWGEETLFPGIDDFDVLD